MEEVKRKFGGKPHEATWNALVDVVARLDSPERAEEVVKAMKQHGVQPSCITYTELIHACRHVGTPAAIERAVKYFDHMRAAHAGSSLEPDTQAYNAMLRLAGLSAKGTAYAITLFKEMQEKHYLPTIYTYSNLIYACSKSPPHYTDAFEYFSAALAQGFKPTTSLFNILLQACAIAGKGDLANAMGLFRMMDKKGVARDTASYNAMLNVLAESQARGDRVPLIAAKDANTPVPEADMVDKGKRIEMAQQLLVQMEQTAVPITLQTVNCAVKVSARALRLNNTPKMQEALLAAHGFEANFHSHKMLVEMYTSANRLGCALERVTAMRAAGHTAPRSLYKDMLKKVAKPKKSMETAEAEQYGQQILQHMKADGHTPRPEDERLFDSQKYGAYLHERSAAALQRDTVKTGVLHSFSQRADAMLRPADRRTGSGRQGTQSERFAANPALAKHKQKRQQRASDAKEKAQGINPTKKREQAIAAGHHYD
jgi:pentatricopeptide repeat protein